MVNLWCFTDVFLKKYILGVTFVLSLRLIRESTFFYLTNNILNDEKVFSISYRGND